MDFGDLTEQRKQRFKDVISNRQFDLTVVLENVHDPHNLGAVLRTCDAIGVPEVYLLYTDRNIDIEALRVGKSSSSGVRKWVRRNLYFNTKECFESIRKSYKQIVATHLDSQAKSLYEINFDESTAIVFGNEHDGLSHEALMYCDCNMIIPQFGMVQSLNISVACAVSLYEACRQRIKAQKYNQEYNDGDANQCNTMKHYIRGHHEKRMNKLLNLRAKKNKM